MALPPAIPVSLRPRSRCAPAMLLLAGVSAAVAAAVVLGCGPETVRTHLRRGRARLAELLGERDDT